MVRELRSANPMALRPSSTFDTIGTGRRVGRRPEPSSRLVGPSARMPERSEVLGLMCGGSYVVAGWFATDGGFK